MNKIEVYTLEDFQDIILPNGVKGKIYLVIDNSLVCGWIIKRCEEGLLKLIAPWKYENHTILKDYVKQYYISLESKHINV